MPLNSQHKLLHQIGIKTAPSEQLVMRSALMDSSLLQHQNLIGMPNCAQPMGDDEAGPLG